MYSYYKYEAVVKPSNLHNGVSYAGQTTFLYLGGGVYVIGVKNIDNI